MPLTREPLILCVDDNHTILSLYYVRLSIEGYRCVPCETFGAALAIAKIIPVALAVLDYDVPGTNGVEMARHLRGLQPSIALVLNSSNLTIPEEEFNMFDVVRLKGASPTSLSESITKLLAR